MTADQPDDDANDNIHLAVRLLAAALPPGDRHAVTEMLEDIDEDELYPALASGLLTLTGTLLRHLAARTNRTPAQALRDQAALHLGPETAGQLVPPAPPAPGDQPHPGRGEITAFAAGLAQRLRPDDTGNRDAVALLSALLAAAPTPAPDGTPAQAHPDLMRTLLREHQDDGGVDRLVAPLLLFGTTALNLVRIFGGPQPEETLQAYGLGLAQGAARTPPHA